MKTVAQSWKAVVAFFAPGLLLLLEPLTLGDGDLQGYDVRRALVVAVVTSLVVWLKGNGYSPDPTTSTPGPGHDRGSVDLNMVATIAIGIVLAAGLLYVLRLAF